MSRHVCKTSQILFSSGAFAKMDAANLDKLMAHFRVSSEYAGKFYVYTCQHFY